MRIHLYYFPGWQVRVDGEQVEPRISDPHGLMEVDVPAGEHRVDAVMGSTPPRTAGTITSWMTLLVLAGLWLWPNRNQEVVEDAQLHTRPNGNSASTV